jgi:hypothetical protein
LTRANSYGRRGGTEVLILKSCPKCKTGAVGVDRDQYGWYEYCIQCGYIRDLIGMVELGQEQAGGRKERRRRARILGKGE